GMRYCRRCEVYFYQVERFCRCCGMTLRSSPINKTQKNRLKEMSNNLSYDEKNTTMHKCSIYKESNQQHIQKNSRILLVDDEPDIILVMKVVLNENGFKVDSYTDPSEALENFTSDLYDLVILDVRMLEMDGFYLYEKIKKLDENVKICFLTAADDAYYEKLKRNYPGINEDCVIHKPVDNESLLRRIKSVL
ncbi:MAG: response regulator, partial [Candidatus Nitrosopolaris sp.]